MIALIGPIGALIGMALFTAGYWSAWKAGMTLYNAANERADNEASRAREYFAKYMTAVRQNQDMLIRDAMSLSSWSLTDHTEN